MKKAVAVILGIVCIIGALCSGYMAATGAETAFAVYGEIAGKFAFPIFFLLLLFDYLGVKKENARLKAGA